MYVNCFVETPFYLRILIYLAKNYELSEKINMKIQIIEKSKKINSEKTVSHFSIRL